MYKSDIHVYDNEKIDQKQIRDRLKQKKTLNQIETNN